MIYSKLRYSNMTMGTILLPSLQLYVKEPSLRVVSRLHRPPLRPTISLILGLSSGTAASQNRSRRQNSNGMPWRASNVSKTTELPLRSGVFKIVTHRDMVSRPPCRASRYSFQQEASNELMSPYSLLLVVVLSAANVERIEQYVPAAPRSIYSAFCRQQHLRRERQRIAISSSNPCKPRILSYILATIVHCVEDL